MTQMVLWFGVLTTVYVATLALRVFALGFSYVGGVGITANLLTLSGLSALTFGSAKIIAANKASAGVVKTPATAPSVLDLVQNDDRQADLGDFQMLLFTVIAALIFVLSSFSFLSALTLGQTTLPELDTTLLSLFGIGQGAYLIKKAGTAAG